MGLSDCVESQVGGLVGLGREYVKGCPLATNTDLNSEKEILGSFVYSLLPKLVYSTFVLFKDRLYLCSLLRM